MLMRYLGITLPVLLLVFSLPFSAPLQADSADISTIETARQTQPEINPHRTADTCDECHLSTEKKAATLRYSDISSTCDRCHRDLREHTTHPVDLPIPATMYKRMNPGFKAAMDRSDGKISCIVCHDLDSQCDHSDKQLAQKLSGRSCMALRGKIVLRSDVCYNCHSVENYQRLNAHKQIDEKGHLDKTKCLICHAQVPEQLPDGRVVNTELHAELDDQRAELCLNCHRPGNHPADSPRHLGKPTPEIIDRMQAMQKVLHIKLPLEPSSGRIYCATCHNPHQPGVIKDPRLADGGDSKKRLRYSDTCMLCHDK